MTLETEYIKSIFSSLGRGGKQQILNQSSLNDREIDILVKRFINGMSLKECADYYGIEVNSLSKKQLKATKKLYNYLKG